MAPSPPARRRRADARQSWTSSWARRTRCARCSRGRSPRCRPCAAPNVTILFYEASTRTRVRFEVAAKNLSARRRQHRGRRRRRCPRARVARGHGPDGRGARRRHARDAPLRLGRPVPRRGRVRRLGAQRRRRLARTPVAGAARPVHAALAAAGRLARGAQGRDPRRRAPLARRAVQHLDAHRDGRRPLAVRPVDAPARVRGVGRAWRGRTPVHRRPRTSTPRCATPTS